MITLEPVEAAMTEEGKAQEQAQQPNAHSAPLVIDEVIAMYEGKLGSLEGALMRMNMQQQKDYELWSAKETAYKEAIEAMTARIAELEGHHPDEQGDAEGSGEGGEEEALAKVKPMTKPQPRKKGRQ